jgi:hypothetical protein
MKATQPMLAACQFTASQIFEAAGLIERAEKVLGRISASGAADILLDRLLWLADFDEARALVAEVDAQAGRSRDGAEVTL